MKYYVMLNHQRKSSYDGETVSILFKDGGKRFLLSTGMKARRPLDGSTFSMNEPSSAFKRARLARIVEEVETYIQNSYGRKCFDDMRDDLTEIVTGKKRGALRMKTFADYVDEYRVRKTHGSTSQLYEYTARKVREFDEDATFDTISVDWLQKFERHFLKTMEVNGLAIQMRNIRTVFNWAIDNGWTDKYPFRRFKIKQQKAVVNNISVEELRTLRDYPVEEWQEIYRDYFMLSFYLCGINPGDMLLLKRANMMAGRITYKRQKTGRLYDIPVVKEAAAIIKKYRGKTYLLKTMDEMADYHTFCQHWNKALKKIGPSEIVPDRLGKKRKILYKPLFPRLTVYSARYTFASIGAELDIPRETIALCLGHAWTDVTSHYIAYDNRKIDKAVNDIVDFVNGKE